MKETNTEKRACSLYIQTDTFLWDHIRNYELSDTNIREEITSLVSQHIKAVNHIYENTDFDGFRGIKFVVQRIKVRYAFLYYYSSLINSLHLLFSQIFIVKFYLFFIL